MKENGYVGCTSSGDAIYKIKDYVKHMGWSTVVLRFPKGKEVVNQARELEGSGFLMRGFHLDDSGIPVIYVL